MEQSEFEFNTSEPSQPDISPSTVVPDLRFQESLLRNLHRANSIFEATWILTRDQVLLPFAQGAIKVLALYALGSVALQARLAGLKLRDILIQSLSMFRATLK